MDTVRLDGSGNMHQVFVDHRNKGCVVFRSQIPEDHLKLLNVILAVIQRQSNAGQQKFDVRIFKRTQHLV
jgi:uncharacterized protein YegL